MFKIWQTFGSYQIFSRKKADYSLSIRPSRLSRGAQKLTAGHIKGEQVDQILNVSNSYNNIVRGDLALSSHCSILFEIPWLAKPAGKMIIA